MNRSSDNLEKCTIYLTHYPDEDCAHAILLARIKKIVYCMYTRSDKRKEEEDMIKAKKILKANKIETRYSMTKIKQ